MTKDEAKQEQARNLRYKRPALALMGYLEAADAQQNAPTLFDLLESMEGA